ncbi:MAG: transglutaminase family protein, partial [Rhodopila sp.]
AFCRAHGIPARYVSAYAWRLQPPDFHAVFEAFPRGPSEPGWYVFDPTRMAAPEGIVRIGISRDAAEVAFCTQFGEMAFDKPEVSITGPDDAAASITQAVRVQDAKGEKRKSMPDNIDTIAARHGFSPAALRAVAEALRHGGGRMAQFNHPELGGMGQWSQGGMIMIGDMNNNDLKARVDALCRELAGASGPVPAAAELEPGQSSQWWPQDLGTPAASGGQNDMRYACFPDKRRLAVMQGGTVRVYDTGEHQITGFSQQQSSSQTLSFTSQNGTVRLEDLKPV